MKFKATVDVFKTDREGESTVTLKVSHVYLGAVAKVLLFLKQTVDVEIVAEGTIGLRESKGG